MLPISLMTSGGVEAAGGICFEGMVTHSGVVVAGGVNGKSELSPRAVL